MKIRLPISKYILSGLVLLLFSGNAHSAWHSCKPVQVMEKDTLIHVRCENTFIDNGNTIQYLTISSADAERANRFISMSMTALASGKYFSALWLPASDNVAGCGVADCRSVQYFSLSLF